MYFTLLLFFIHACTGDILKLENNFENEISEYPISLVKFYAPWCDYCKKLEPEFIKLSNIMADNDPQITFIEVNCDSIANEICKLHKVSGYPNLKLYINGKFNANYDGNKDAESMANFLKLKFNPASKELYNFDDMDMYLDTLESITIGFFNEKGSNIEAEFNKLAESQKYLYKFAHTYNNLIMKTYGYRDDIVLFRGLKLKTKAEQSEIKFEDKVNLYNLRNWVTSTYHGLAGVRTMVNKEQFHAPLIVVYYNFDFVNKAAESHYVRNRAIMAASEYTKGKKKVTFAVSNATEFERELIDFGINMSLPQPYVTARDPNHKKYIMDKQFCTEALKAFVEDMWNGDLISYTISQNAPQSSDNLITTAVGGTFERYVIDIHLDVVLQLFAPWSAMCKNATKLLETVAKKFKNETSISFVKIDITSNEVPAPFAMKAYPTIYFVPWKLKLHPILYKGENTVSDYIKFIAKRSTKPLYNYDRDGRKIKKTQETKIEL